MNLNTNNPIEKNVSGFQLLANSQLTDRRKNVVLTRLVEQLEPPESVYQKADELVEGLNAWFARADSSVAHSRPRIFSHGAFGLGTVVRPLDENAPYHLDLVCKLGNGFTKEDHTQFDVKSRIGRELESYRFDKGIKTPIQGKRRYWQMASSEDIGICLKLLPCIPVTDTEQKRISKALKQSGYDEKTAVQLAEKSVSITDFHCPAFSEHIEDWTINNPEGYGVWFKIGANRFHRLTESPADPVDAGPSSELKSPLPRCVRLLKRHRDVMFEGVDEIEPLSMIITTLATHGYAGQADLASTLVDILTKMGQFIQSIPPRVPNPVNPENDLARRWHRPEHVFLNHEHHFRTWLHRAVTDFGYLLSRTDTDFITDEADRNFRATLDASAL